MTLDSPAQPPAEKRRRLDRVTAACDFCKKRKVKCNGEQPCTYCISKERADTCTFTTPKRAGEPSDGTRQRNHASNVAGPGSSPTVRQGRSTLRENPAANVAGLESSPTVSRDGFHHEDTVVPREGRILRDAEGKFIFIGDCAPLSFLQTVRYLVASEADPDGFTAQVSRDSIIEFARPDPESRIYDIPATSDETSATIEEYLIATCGLVDLFEREELFKEIGLWAKGNTSHSDDAVTAVLFLVLAIGSQEGQTEKSEAWAKHAKDLLLKHMCSSMNVATVQGFALLAIYMLRAFQPNGAYLYFSLAARTAYAIGIHRTEVNASFGPLMRRMRDRIWKSLRVVDMLISSQIGRPPCTSDVDCTVKYGVSGQDGNTTPDILDASVQIFMIIEQVVVQVYSRKRISLRIADYVSRQLKNWAVKWLQALSDRTKHPEAPPRDTVVGACSTLCSYYYGIMLLTRPFLIYELYEYMGASMRGGGTQSDHLKKRQYADAALDAAASLVETLESVIASHRMPRRMPLIVSWLFTASLALAVGVLGRPGLTFESNCEASIRCLEYFGEADPHARQYSLITRSLLSNTTRHVKKREQQLRAQCKQASSNLFGMLSSGPEQNLNEPYEQRQRLATSSVNPERTERNERTNPTSTAPIDWTIYDSDFFATSWSSNEYDQGLQDFLQPGAYNLDGASVADIPLFPIYDQQMGSGHAA